MSEILKNTGYIVEFKFGNYLIVPEKQRIPENLSFIDVHGTLADRQTGEQLPYATIFLPEQKAYVSTSLNGTFSFKIQNFCTSPKYTVSWLSAYRQYCSDKWRFYASVFQNETEKHGISAHSGEKRKGKNDWTDYDPGRKTVNPMAFVNLPNMSESDVFRTMQLLPGIGYMEGSSGLSIRGGTTDQNLILFDGFTLYNLDHFLERSRQLIRRL